MGREGSKVSSKDSRSPDKSGREHKRKHKHKSDKERSGKRARKNDSHVHIVDDDADEDEWMEKNIDMDGEAVLAADIPTSESLKMKTRAEVKPGDPPLPPSLRTQTFLQRDEWMLMPGEEPTIPEVQKRLDLPTGEEDITSRRDLPTGEEQYTYTEGYGEPSQDARTMTGGVDFFSNLGTERKRKPKEADRPDPDKLHISSKELNTNLREGKSTDNQPPPTQKSIVPGGPGSQWRMMKLKRVYEAAEAEGKSIEEVAMERFESLDAFEEAKEERRILDEREGKRTSRGGQRKEKGKEPEGERRVMFTDLYSASGTPSRGSSFRRPDLGGSTPTTPGPTAQEARSDSRYDLLRTATPPEKSHAPIPSVAATSASLVGVKRRALSPSSLNKLQAKVLRAKLMNAPDAEQLEKEYNEEIRKARGEEGEDNVRVEVLPTVDVRGNLYDVGSGSGENALPPGNRRPKEKVETRDPQTGEIIRYNGDDDNLTLGEMLRQERFRSGPKDEKNLDAMLARTIATDGGFEDNIDYMDDNADKLGRKKGRSEQQKRLFAINDFKRTQKALATCSFCYGEDDSPPKAPVVAMGTRAYLSCTLTEELVDGHCLIVPIQHHLTSLEADDDVWDEVRNFMKCLMRMCAEEDKGVIFYETVISLKPQKHTYIECVPLSWDQFEVIPGYFKESILMSETEWSQHKKLIDFSARPGGFRRAMVPNLPYFMVQFDYKGEKGYGHVIEGTGEAADPGGDNAEGDIDEGAAGGGEFPRYFAAEIIGNLLDLEPRRWRRPRRFDFVRNKERTEKFRQKYEKYDWTGMIGSAE
ncbi:hypothetical protein OBBRIDRAFT_752448 [Obba rivulosa]|uniref:Uncharacterized protein n=1 Tax=Obba rivulosa TaxID=1052685 RepID=A0A8E2DM92_9APHY|nr:hypothetical protein OBBRIDRAFT_752448 [Obba rivulosa]